jgi:hypothetical protein
MKKRGLEPTDFARIASLRERWKWVGAQHHKAMQEAIHDPSIKGLSTAAARCDARARYGMKYASDSPHPVPQELRAQLVSTVNAQYDHCTVAAPGRIFASRLMSPVPAPTVVLADTINIDAITNYVHALGNSLQEATSLADANTIINSYLATAATDPAMSAIAVDAVAAAASISYRSAAEWDDYWNHERSYEMSLFVWGWLSDIGQWVSQVVKGDVYGCGGGMGVALFGMGAAHWSGSPEEFGLAMGGACIAGGVIGSVQAAFQ